MEFPDIGEYCSLSDCHRLDFLPIKCSSCKKIFCREHFSFDAHHCDGPEHNHQVPVCPLCDKPVALKFGESPDIVVSRHIDQNCDDRREPVFKNRCSVSGCRQKEMIPLECDKCRRNHCIRHRHPADHNCSQRSNSEMKRQLLNTTTTLPVPPPKSQSIPSSLNSLTQRGIETWENLRTNMVRSFKGSNTAASGAASAAPMNTVSNIQGDLTEDEALRIAIQESLEPTSSSIASSTNQNQTRRSTSGSGEKCSID